MSTNRFSIAGSDVRLRDVALGAEVAARRDRGQGLQVAVHEMGDADHRRLRLGGELPAVAGQAFVGVERDLVALDGVRDHRRLLRPVARLALVVVDLARQAAAAAAPRPAASGRAGRTAAAGAAPAASDTQGGGEDQGRVAWPASRLLHPAGAFLEVGLLGDRVGLVERDLVDQLARVEPGHEHDARAAACRGRGSRPGSGSGRGAIRPRPRRRAAGRASAASSGCMNTTAFGNAL